MRKTLLTIITILSISISNTYSNEKHATKSSDKKETKMTKTVRVQMETTLGNIIIELYPDKAPVSVKNFLKYVDDGFYRGTIFHRVIKDFVIQGGGFTQEMVQKPTRSPIKNEATNGLKNDRGTIAMARTMVIDSATSQFYINLKNNDFLNHRDNSPQGFGMLSSEKLLMGWMW